MTWLCMLSWLKAFYCSLLSFMHSFHDHTVLLNMPEVFFSYVVNVSLTKACLAAFESFQCFPLVHVMGWGPPEVRLWWQGLCPWCWLTIKTTGWIQGCSYVKWALETQSVVLAVFVTVWLILEHMLSLFLPSDLTSVLSHFPIWRKH